MLAFFRENFFREMLLRDASRKFFVEKGFSCTVFCSLTTSSSLETSEWRYIETVKFSSIERCSLFGSLIKTTVHKFF